MSRDAAQDRRTDVRLAAVAAALTIYFLATFWSSLHYVSTDTTLYLLPWYDHILQNGRLPSLEGSFANYSPPYIYLLSLGSLLSAWLQPIVVIKIGCLGFMAASSWLFWSLCRAMGCSQNRSLIAAWILFVAPEVAENTLQWGQSDILYTTFILLFLRLMLARRPGWSMAALGIALSIKLQTIFIGPVILAMLLAGELPVWTLLAVALGYAAMMTPAALAGRPWKELLLVYTQQYGYYQDVALHAANPYQIFVPWTKRSPRAASLVVDVGLVVAAVATIALVTWLVRQMRSGRWDRRGMLIAAVAFSMLLEPYVLPKMHDRYFFAGNVVVILLAMLVPRAAALPAVLLQGAALIMYYPFLFQVHARGSMFLLGIAMSTAALALLLVALRRNAFALGGGLNARAAGPGTSGEINATATP